MRQLGGTLAPAARGAFAPSRGGPRGRRPGAQQPPPNAAGRPLRLWPTAEGSNVLEKGGQRKRSESGQTSQTSSSSSTSGALSTWSFGTTSGSRLASAASRSASCAWSMPSWPLRAAGQWGRGGAFGRRAADGVCSQGGRLRGAHDPRPGPGGAAPEPDARQLRLRAVIPLQQPFVGLRAEVPGRLGVVRAPRGATRAAAHEQRRAPARRLCDWDGSGRPPVRRGRSRSCCFSYLRMQLKAAAARGHRRRRGRGFGSPPPPNERFWDSEGILGISLCECELGP